MIEVPSYFNQHQSTSGLTVALVDWHNDLSPQVAAAVIRLFCETYGDRYHQAYTKTPSALDHARRRAKTLTFLVLNAQGEPVGHAALSPVNAARAKYERAVVSARYRGCGIGKLLLNSALQHAKDTEVAYVWAEAVTSRATSEHLLTSAGFSPVGIHLDKFNDYFGCGCRESTIVLARSMKEGHQAKADVGEEGRQIRRAARSPLSVLSGSSYREMSQIELWLGPEASVGTLERVYEEKSRLFFEDYLSIAIDCPWGVQDSIAQWLKDQGFIFASRLPGSSVRRYQRFKSREWQHLVERVELSPQSRSYVDNFLLL